MMKSANVQAVSEMETHSALDLRVVKKVIRPGMVVVDASRGGPDWAHCVLELVGAVTIHMFEPDQEAFRELEEELSADVYDGRVVLHRFDLCDVLPEKLRERLGAWSIGILFLGNRPDASSAIQCMGKLYARGRIDYTIMTPPADDLGLIVDEMSMSRTEVFRLPGCGQELLAVSDRFRNLIRGRTQHNDFGVMEVCKEFGIECRGVIQLGAAYGEDGADLLAAGARRIVMVEANPALYPGLAARYARDVRFITVHCAITDQDGTINLRVMSQPLSSSVLPLSHHKEVYPDIDEVKQVEVDSRTLDSMMRELDEAGVEAGEFNFMKMDIQGAEILALKGGAKMLQGIDAILTEVFFTPLYEGSASIDEIDEVLESHGFVRVATNSVNHESWGDAFYVRCEPRKSDQPCAEVMPMKSAASIDPASQVVWDAMPLRVERQKLTQHLINLSSEELGRSFKTQVWPFMQKVMGSDLRMMPLLMEEYVASEQLAQSASQGKSHPKFVNCMLAAMLYRPLSEITLPLDRSEIPQWLVDVARESPV